MEMTIENIELLYTPLTKKLLINYVKAQYEENADISEESLRTELIWLHENNELDQLFLGEYLLSKAKLTQGL
ncbi:hypothetical protein [Tenacibaculum retecalamus]|uniref:hypothetical protein n=1 Tax=Tenacibaculum retecalamus TaxID=3018315 RepID=UPI0023D92B72|nr:hypothetical protein [Tenacibaculum retecalamus]WBX70879.1 hypothetical protein PG912_11715 [Tenacibaculum retecalamus]